MHPLLSHKLGARISAQAEVVVPEHLLNRHEKEELESIRFCDTRLYFNVVTYLTKMLPSLEAPFMQSHPNRLLQSFSQVVEASSKQPISSGGVHVLVGTRLEHGAFSTTESP